MSGAGAIAQTSLWLLVLVPAVVGGVLSMARRAERAAAPISLATATMTVALSAMVAWQRPEASIPFMAGADFALEVDALSALVVSTVSVVTLLVLVFSVADIQRSSARFHGLMLLFGSAAALTATAATLPTLLFAWEVMGATSYALIGFWWREDHRVSAGLTAFVTTRAGDLGLYAAAAAALAGGAGLALSDLPGSSPGWRHVVALGVLLAACGKAAQLPFSFWLSRAMEGPSPVSALLHSAAMVAMGGYLLLRTEPLLAATGWAGPVAAWVGAVTALLLGAVAVAQRDLKQLLAASTAAQLGFVVMAAGLSTVAGGAAHLVAHASTKALLFLAAGSWLAALGSKDLVGLQGVARRWRLVGASATVGALALAGVAPLSLWATKDVVLATAREESLWLYGVALVASALSAAYAGKLLVVIWRPVRRPNSHDGATLQEQAGSDGPRIARQEQVAITVLAVGAAALGVLALPPAGGALARAVDEGEGLHVLPLELAVSAVLAVGVVLAVARWGVPEPRWALDWLGLDRAADALVVRPVLRLARALAQLDDGVLDRTVMAAATGALAVAARAAIFDHQVFDRGVEALSRGSLRAARAAAVADDEGIDAVVEGSARRIRTLGALARRPQTGQLHHYYVQAVAVFAAGLLLLATVR